MPLNELKTLIYDFLLPYSLCSILLAVLSTIRLIGYTIFAGGWG